MIDSNVSVALGNSYATWPGKNGERRCLSKVVHILEVDR